MQKMNDLLETGVYETLAPSKAMTVRDLLKELNLSSDGLLTVLVNGKKARLDDEITPKDEVNVIPMIAGGDELVIGVRNKKGIIKKTKWYPEKILVDREDYNKYLDSREKYKEMQAFKEFCEIKALLSCCKLCKNLAITKAACNLLGIPISDLSFYCKGFEPRKEVE